MYKLKFCDLTISTRKTFGKNRQLAKRERTLKKKSTLTVQIKFTYKEKKLPINLPINLHMKIFTMGTYTTCSNNCKYDNATDVLRKK